MDIHCASIGEVEKNLEDSEQKYFGISTLTDICQKEKSSEVWESKLWENLLHSPFTTDLSDTEHRDTVPNSNVQNNYSPSADEKTQNSVLSGARKTSQRTNVLFDMKKCMENFQCSKADPYLGKTNANTHYSC